MKYLIVILLLIPLLSIGQQTLEPWTLTRIVDGDTIYAMDSIGQEIKFRLIGIDAPESKHPFKPVEAYSFEATEMINSLLDNDSIYIEFDIEQYDRYGRTLAYVYTHDKKMVNSELVKAGLAKISTYPPNVKYVDTFIDNQKYARKAKKGIWSNI